MRIPAVIQRFLDAVANGTDLHLSAEEVADLAGYQEIQDLFYQAGGHYVRPPPADAEPSLNPLCCTCAWCVKDRNGAKTP